MWEGEERLGPLASRASTTMLTWGRDSIVERMPALVATCMFVFAKSMDFNALGAYRQHLESRLGVEGRHDAWERRVHWGSDGDAASTEYKAYNY